MSDTPKALLKRRLSRMKADQQLRAPFVNEVYRLAMPQRQRVGQEKMTPMTEEEVQDLLDTTFAETADDFASDMISMFTPAHEPWVTHEPTKALNKDQQRQAAAQIKSAVDWLWDDVQESSYYDAADECFHDLVAGTMAMRMREYGAAQPLCYEAVPISELLLDVGPDRAPDGRFTEGLCEKSHFAVNYGRYVDWKSLPGTLTTKFRNAKDDARFKVSDGVYRVWDKPGMTQWRRVVLLEGEIVYEKFYDEDGAEQFYVTRWRTEKRSAYGIGPGWWACAPQRVLVELAALTLGGLHKTVDPSYAFSDPDGTANLEQGLAAGDYLQLGEGFDVKKLSGDGDLNAAFFQREDLRQLIKSALYQDRPEQRGDTPPTATQWADESARTQQRWEIPRGKVYREWVIPIIRGHQWQRTRHGIFPKIQIGADAVMLKPQSPQAKARSFDKVAKAERVLASAGSPALAQAAPLVIDGRKTLANIKSELGDDIVAVRSQQEIDQMAQQAAALAQQQGGLAQQ
ncbi:MAG: hypothetical protein E6R03_12170 [Hyphomicrobiaceae bacterium]|nr:MAG: hypothetical protein E6R03_12170 [Hyphomicrobiaceae bacterium]